MVARRLQRPAEPGALGPVLDVLARGLSPKPDERFASVEALVQALSSAC
jgi:hypothetical protein